MAIDSKQIFMLAIGIIIVSVFITSVVFVSGCVGGGNTCTSNNIDNCTTSQACFNGVCTAKCSNNSDCTAANTICRSPTNDESKSATTPNEKFCLSKTSETTTTTSTTTTQESSDSLLKTTVYIIDPLKVKPLSNVNVKIEVMNKEKINLFKNAKEPGGISFNNLVVNIDSTSAGLKGPTPSFGTLGEKIDRGESNNASVAFTLTNPNAMVGSEYTFTYTVKTMGSASSISLLNTSSNKNDFMVSLTNNSGNYSITIDPDFSFAPLYIKFKANGNTSCNNNICTKEYNITYTLKDEQSMLQTVKGYNLHLKNIKVPIKNGGDTAVNILTHQDNNVVSDISKETPSTTLSGINFTVQIDPQWSLSNGEKKDFKINLLSVIEKTDIINYKGETKTAHISITSCDKSNQCKSNEDCKDGKCVANSSSSTTGDKSGMV